MPLMTDDEWATRVAQQAGIADVDAVKDVLAEAGLTAGRPPTGQHSLKVEGVYFAGVKLVRPATAGEGDAQAASTERPTAESGPADAADLERLPFAFHYLFKAANTPVTVFATDHKNDAGKSTILRVILWALRGTSHLQPDVRKAWLREAAVVLEVDNDRLLVQWRIHGGRPTGSIVALRPNAAIDWAALADDALLLAQAEIATLDDPSGDRWPANDATQHLVDNGHASVLSSFESEDEFKAASQNQMLPRLGLDAIPVWASRAGGVDSEDARLTSHGWSALSAAVAILDPAEGAVLGEEKMTASLILGLFLGSTWGPTSTSARWQLRRAQSQLAGLRRRLEEDQVARAAGLEELQAALAQARLGLSGFGSVPDAATVAAANDTANRDSIAAIRAKAETRQLAADLGEAERAVTSAEEDIHALEEAEATKRFWHSLRPSCCPRCDAKIDEEMWRREREGQCSLCSNDFEEREEPTDDAVDVAIENAPDEDSADELVVLREQLDALKLRVVEVDLLHEAARAEERRLAALADESARVRDGYDVNAASERHVLELRVFGLEARVEERTRVNNLVGQDAATGDTVPLAPQETLVTVLNAAESVARGLRDTEQRELLTKVSEVITRLGKQFGIRNLQTATLQANANLPVIKGSERANFGDLTPGERLRLRVALVVGLLEVGESSQAGRHPRLLIIDDITGHEVADADAIAMAQALAGVPDLQTICASTYGPELSAALAPGSVVMPPQGQEVQF
jgi:hypothetical protein